MIDARATNRAARRFTRVVDEHRWLFIEWAGKFEAHCQKQCDNCGNSYFKFVGPKAQFDTTEARDKFVASFPAAKWERS